MRVVVLGGSGHVGTFLVPRLVEAGHEVVSVSRGRREPYQIHPAWLSVEQVTLDREVEEAEDTLGGQVLALERSCWATGLATLRCRPCGRRWDG
jgi:uncharacterized protein YbjT (DUF2867 family)